MMVRWCISMAIISGFVAPVPPSFGKGLEYQGLMLFLKNIQGIAGQIFSVSGIVVPDTG